ncbi:MAG: hypothetical protein OXC37_04970, partial [Bdellovibrionaceae bacterium]|nr:hypothetical protein [Pseudobdellovibrionaceae bacterium]
FDSLGVKVCVPSPKGVNIADADCPSGKILKGFDNNGNKICVDSDRSLANVKCPTGQVLTGFNSSGNKICVADVSKALANLKCGTGEVLQGFDSQGDKICVAMTSGGGGGGGGTTTNSDSDRGPVPTCGWEGFRQKTLVLTPGGYACI